MAGRKKNSKTTAKKVARKKAQRPRPKQVRRPKPVAKSARDFDYSLDYSKINFRKTPSKYRVGKGEQGVLMVEPYKSEILPFWRFKTPTIARKSARELAQVFKRYRDDDDFVGMDMTRKFVQMGYTRARRYANHKSGTKYATDGSELPQEIDTVKAESAEIFFKAWRKLEADSVYLSKKTAWKLRYG